MALGESRIGALNLNAMAGGLWDSSGSSLWTVGSMHDSMITQRVRCLCWIKEGGSCRCNPCPAVRKMEPRRLLAARVDACNPLASPLTITPAKAPLYKIPVIAWLY